MVRVGEPRGCISWDAIIEHALELVRIGGGRGVEEGGRGVNGRLMKSAILMVWEARGVKRPGIHVVRFYQPICKAKALLEKMTQVQRFSSFNQRPIGKEVITKSGHISHRSD